VVESWWKAGNAPSCWHEPYTSWLAGECQPPHHTWKPCALNAMNTSPKPDGKSSQATTSSQKASEGLPGIRYSSTHTRTHARTHTHTHTHARTHTCSAADDECTGCSPAHTHTRRSPVLAVSCSVQHRKRESGLPQLSSCQVMSRGLRCQHCQRGGEVSYELRDTGA
jgi:hypothetical protein